MLLALHKLVPRISYLLFFFNFLFKLMSRYHSFVVVVLTRKTLLVKNSHWYTRNRFNVIGSHFKTRSQGCALNLKLIFLSPFFCNFVYFKSIGGKTCTLFTNGGIICTPLFFPLTIIFFPNHLFGHIFFFKYAPLHGPDIKTVMSHNQSINVYAWTPADSACAIQNEPHTTYRLPSFHY